MTNPFQNFDWNLKSISKIFGVFILGIVALAIIAGIIAFAFRIIVSPFTSNFGANYREGYGRGGGGGGGIMMEDASYSAKGGISRATSNILPPIIQDGEIVDATAEDYEIKNYSVNYQTSNKTKICKTIFDLKSDPEIIFSNSSESEQSCNFTFEVPNEREEEVLEVLENLDPENLHANIHTIQRSVERTSDQLEILTKKLAQTEATLSEAQEAYEDLMKLAQNSQDVENLTELIKLKIEAIEQLAQTRIATNQQIQQVQNSRAEQLRKIANTTFHVSVYEQRFIDWKNIVNDWKNEIRNFVDNLNNLFQFVSIKLISFVLHAVVAMLYVAVAFVFLKLLWLAAKKIFKLDFRF
jgi:hypothetical protein